MLCTPNNRKKSYIRIGLEPYLTARFRLEAINLGYTFEGIGSFAMSI